MATLRLSTLLSHQDTTEVYTFLLALQYKQGDTSDTEAVTQIISCIPACSGHVVVIQSEKTPDKMQL